MPLCARLDFRNGASRMLGGVARRDCPPLSTFPQRSGAAPPPASRCCVAFGDRLQYGKLREGDMLAQIPIFGGLVRDRDRINEMLLELRLDGRLDLLDR